MPKRSPKLLAAFTLVCLAFAAGAASQSALAAQPAVPAVASLPPARDSCDRECLVGIADAYFAAALTHSPDKLPLSSGERMTENTQVIPVGQGLLWRGMSAPLGGYRIDVVDPVSGQIAVATVATIAGQKYLMALRLKVRDRQITEIEQLLANNIQPLAEPNLVRPRAAFRNDVPVTLRNTRTDMVRIADSYFDALTSEDSSRTFLASDCERHEMGLQTTGNAKPINVMLPTNTPKEAQRSMRILMDGIMTRSCKAQIDSGVFADLHKVEPRRPIVIDEQKGLVATFPLFIQNGDVRSTKLVGYPGLDKLTPPLPFSTQWIEIFKIHSSSIHEIEATVMLPLYYGTGNGWDEGSGL